MRHTLCNSLYFPHSSQIILTFNNGQKSDKNTPNLGMVQVQDLILASWEPVRCKLFVACLTGRTAFWQNIAFKTLVSQFTTFWLMQTESFSIQIFNWSMRPAIISTSVCAWLLILVPYDWDQINQKRISSCKSADGKTMLTTADVHLQYFFY